MVIKLFHWNSPRSCLSFKKLFIYFINLCQNKQKVTGNSFLWPWVGLVYLTLNYCNIKLCKQYTSVAVSNCCNIRFTTEKEMCSYETVEVNNLLLLSSKWQWHKGNKDNRRRKKNFDLLGPVLLLGISCKWHSLFALL